MTHTGYCLAELMLALGLLAVFLALGFAQFSGALDKQQARSAAQSAQAAIAWAQTEVLWQGGTRQVSMDEQGLSTAGGADEAGVDLGAMAPTSPVSSNISRWNNLDGVALSFLYPFGAPDSGGSLYFGEGKGSYKVTVRPESGLTVRSVVR